MKNKCVLILLLVFSQALHAQWISNYYGNTSHNNPLSNAVGKSVTVDNAGYCYVTGYCDEMMGTGKDILIIKYHAQNGDTAWVRTVNGLSNSDDVGYKIATDSYQNVYVAGTISNSSNYYTTVLVKLNDSGYVQWQTTYSLNSVRSDGKAVGIAIDNSNNIYVTGYCTNDDSVAVMITVKYNSSGDSLWSMQYCPDNLESQGVNIKLSSDGTKVFVLGYVTDSVTQSDITLICYESFNGNQIFIKKVNGGGNAEDRAFGIAVDDQDNIHIAGYITADSTGNIDCITIKYSSAGDSLWARTYNGAGNSEDRAFGIAVDEDGAVFVTGFTTSSLSGKNYLLLAYTSTGADLWPSEKTYDGAASEDDIACGIAIVRNLDSTESIIITGFSWSINNNDDYVTIRYDAENGDTQTVDIYSMTTQTEDQPQDIAVDTNSNAYITGLSQLIVNGPSGQTAATTLKMQTFRGKYDKIKQLILPTAFKLFQNYPNPFNPSTTIKFDIPKGSVVKLTVYDILGRTVSVLINEYLNPGSYNMKYTFSNLASGIYFYELRTGDLRDVKKMSLIK